MDAADRELVEDLYRALARYERPETFRVSPRTAASMGATGEADDDGDIEVPAPGGDRPLRTLKQDDVRVVWEVTPDRRRGDLDVYRHYLPRILEIVAEGGWATPPQPGWEHSERFFLLAGLDRLPNPPWSQWPKEEADAIRGFLERFGRFPAPPLDPKDGPLSGGETCSARVDGIYVHNIEVSFFRDLVPVDEGHPSYEPERPYRNGPFVATMIFPSTLPPGVGEALQRGDELVPVNGSLAGRPFVAGCVLCVLPGDPSRSWVMLLEDLDGPDDERWTGPPRG